MLTTDPITGRIKLVAPPSRVPQHRRELQAAADRLEQELLASGRPDCLRHLSVLRRWAGLETWL